MNNVNWHDAAECLRLLSHPHRLQVIALLLEGEYSVGELAKACDVLQNVMSEHLGLMKHKGFIKARKVGNKVYYTIQEPAMASIMSCIRRRFTRTEQEK